MTGRAKLGATKSDTVKLESKPSRVKVEKGTNKLVPKTEKEKVETKKKKKEEDATKANVQMSMVQFRKQAFDGPNYLSGEDAKQVRDPAKAIADGLYGVFETRKMNGKAELKNWCEAHNAAWNAILRKGDYKIAIAPSIQYAGIHCATVDLSRSQTDIAVDTFLESLFGTKLEPREPKTVDAKDFRLGFDVQIKRAVDDILNSKLFVLLMASDVGGRVELGCIEIHPGWSFVGEEKDEMPAYLSKCAAMLGDAVKEAQQNGTLKLYTFCPFGTITTGKLVGPRPSATALG